jgi:type II secretory pathway pseudopilin PulG
VKHLKDSRGVSLYEITAAVAMTGILAAVAVPVIIDKVSEAKSARAIQETDGLFKAISAFQKDTGRMPGEVEGFKLIVTSDSLTTTPLPDDTNATLTTGTTGGTCTSVVTVAPGTAAAAVGKCGNVNDYLVRNPNTIFGYGTPKYQNWRGPYIDEIQHDPFDRAYVVNIRALYRAELDSTTVSCGYGWILSGGPNRALETFLTASNFASTSDDIGKNNGKKQPPGTPGC